MAINPPTVPTNIVIVIIQIPILCDLAIAIPYPPLFILLYINFWLGGNVIRSQSLARHTRILLQL